MDDAPVIELAGLSEAQRKAYILADNRLALNTGWDLDLPGVELAHLQSMGFDVALIGFGEEEIATLTNRGMAGLTDPADIPESLGHVDQQHDLQCHEWRKQRLARRL